METQFHQLYTLKIMSFVIKNYSPSVDFSCQFYSMLRFVNGCWINVLSKAFHWKLSKWKYSLDYRNFCSDFDLSVSGNQTRLRMAKGNWLKFDKIFRLTSEMLSNSLLIIYSSSIYILRDHVGKVQKPLSTIPFSYTSHKNPVG